MEMSTGLPIEFGTYYPSISNKETWQLDPYRKRWLVSDMAVGMSWYGKERLLWEILSHDVLVWTSRDP